MKGTRGFSKTSSESWNQSKRRSFFVAFIMSSFTYFRRLFAPLPKSNRLNKPPGLARACTALSRRKAGWRTDDAGGRTDNQGRADRRTARGGDRHRTPKRALLKQYDRFWAGRRSRFGVASPEPLDASCGVPGAAKIHGMRAPWSSCPRVHWRMTHSLPVLRSPVYSFAEMGAKPPRTGPFKRRIGLGRDVKDERDVIEYSSGVCPGQPNVAIIVFAHV